MQKIKLFGGFGLIIGSIFYSVANSTLTGAVLGNIRENPFNVGTFLVLFMSGMFLLTSATLEDKVEKKDNFATRIKKSLAARAVGAAILGGAGAYGGHQAGEALQPYARPVERAYNVGKLILGNVIPGSAEYNKEVAKKYLSEAGVNGKEYLLKRNARNDRNYLKKIEESLRLLQDTVGNATHKGTEAVPGLRQAQNLKDEIYTRVGKILGLESIDKRSDENYRENYNALVLRELNALIRLSQVNGQIDNTLNQLAMQAAKPEKNKDAISYLAELSQEANNIYGFLDGNEDLSVDQIYSGGKDSRYTEIRDIGSSIKGADYPISDNLPEGATALGAALGAYLGLRRRKVGDASIATGKYALKAGRKAAPYARQGATYIGKKARQVQERIASRRKIK